MKFVIEDERHAEQHGVFECLDDAVAELRRRAQIPWDSAPNRAPCQNWRNCGRRYEILEYEATERPWRQVRRLHALDVTANGPEWIAPFQAD